MSVVSLVAFFVFGLTVALVSEALVSVYGIVNKRNDIADVMWGTVFCSVVLVMLFLIPQPNFIFKLLCVLVLIWGIRLTLHIGTRHFGKKSEDPRYAQWRDSWKWVKTRSFFQVYLLQGLFATVVLSSFITYTSNPGDTPWLLVIIGLIVWITGFVFEIVGDWQLGHFIKDPANYGLKKTDLMTAGLWSYTRHPNYFGEMTMWWGIWLITLHTINPIYIAVSAIGPITITYLLIFVSGVAKTEEHWAKKYGKKFTVYAESTPKLIPLRIFKSK